MEFKNSLKVLPFPKKVEVEKKYVFVKALYYCEHNLNHCLAYLDKVLGVKPNYASKENASIIALIDTSINGYKIEVKNGKVNILASNLQNLNYAFATLVLSAKPTKKSNYIKIEQMLLEDNFDSGWRGISIDVCRRFHPISYLYKAVDICWLYKINVLQIHFTDDESYTLPSKVLPNLSTKDNCYSFAELRALIEYAKDREITLVPEIDMPGHTTQFMLKYPQIFGKGDILMLSDKVFNTLYRLIDELLELFCYSPYIHLGGDEAKFKSWQKCKKSKKYILEKGLKDEQEAYAYFLKLVTDYVLKKGRTPILWEGFNKSYNHLISKDVLIIAWESYYQLAPEFLESGFKVINCSWKPLYIVTDRIYWTYKEILAWNKYTWDHFWEESQASKNKIVVEKTKNVLGAQICAWGDELVKSPSCEGASFKEFNLIRQNLPAMSQALWNEDSGILEEDFLSAFKHTDKVLSKILY